MENNANYRGINSDVKSAGLVGKQVPRAQVDNNSNYMGSNASNYSGVKNESLVGRQIPRTQVENNSNYMGINTSNYSAIKNKSLVGKQIPRTQKEHVTVSRSDVKKAFIAIGAAATIFGFGLSGISSCVSSFIDDKQTVSKYLYDNRAIVSENTHRTDDKNGFWYDTDDMAFSVSESEADKEALIYAVYSNLSYNRTIHMNSFMESLSSYDLEYQQYKDFDDYVIKKGFVNEDGKADKKGYEKYMDKYISKLAKLEEVKSEIGGKSK